MQYSLMRRARRQFDDYRTGQFLGRIPFVSFGAGTRPLVVISGGNAFVRRFTPDRAMRDAARVAHLFPRDFRVHLLGYDAAPAAGYDAAAIARDIAAIIRAELGSATVAGISFGAFVSLRLAQESPDAVRDLILLAGAHRFSAEGRRRVRQQIEDARRGDFVAMVQPFLTLFRRPWLNATMRVATWLRRGTLQASMNPADTIVHMLDAALRAGADADPDRLKQIRARTLIVGGTADQFFDVDAFRETAEWIQGARLELFDRETHMLPVERSRDVAALIARFVGR